MSAPRRPRRGRGAPPAEEHDASGERWLLTYADMITLLMVLFIVLFAISVVDKKKFAALAGGLTHSFGASNKVLPNGTGVLDGGKTANADAGQLANNPTSPIAPINQADIAANAHAVQQQVAKQDSIKAEKATLTDAELKIAAALRAQGLEASTHLTIDARGLVVSIIANEVIFDVGRAELKPAGDLVLDAIGPTLATLPNDISVEGHTDNVPITGGPFASNWELSAVRATTVLRYLVANNAIATPRLSAVGYADTRPVVANDTVAHRSQNRRVDVVVLSMLASPADASATASPGPSSSSAAPSASINPGARPTLIPITNPLSIVTTGTASK
jgi:chemotaxis protein MotB